MESRSYIAIPPGVTIKEQLDERGMSQKEFAKRMDASEKYISQLIKGDVSLTQDAAYKLEMVLGIPASFWNNLEAIYKEKLKKVEEENNMASDVEILKQVPYSAMSKRGWVAKTSNPYDKVINTRKFFEVATLTLIEKAELLPRIACRRLSITEKSDFALITWAQKAKIEARNIDTNCIDLQNLSNSLETIRSMTVKDPGEFCCELEKLLARCGIALVFLPHIGGSFLHGASFYDGNKIVIGLTVRGKDADKFWFSLFHELGHVLLGHLDKPNGTEEQDEIAADKFARNILIEESDFKAFVDGGIFTKDSIKSFAKSINIDPGIVVGRLQKEGYVEFSWFNDLKTRYEIVS